MTSLRGALDPGASVERTAEFVGYRTVRKFFSVFRTLVGVSPARYVEDSRLDETESSGRTLHVTRSAPRHMRQSFVKRAHANTGR